MSENGTDLCRFLSMASKTKYQVTLLQDSMAFSIADDQSFTGGN